MKRSLALALGFAFLVAASAGAPARFSAPQFDNAVDLHGDPGNADLVVFAGGNQWFAMPDLVAAFQAAHPEIHSVFYETLPPGVLAAQIERGELDIDNLELREHADVYLSLGAQAKALQGLGFVTSLESYASNGLGIMVRAGNPLHIRSLRDLGRSDVRVAMPNIKTEGIARTIEASYVKAGGAALEATIMQEKVAAGTTILTAIHHRETPRWILDGKVDAGPVWMTEAQYQVHIGSGIQAVAVPASEDVTATYVASLVNGAPHRAAAQAFLAFLLSPRGQAIYRSYGFAPAVSTKESR